MDPYLVSVLALFCALPLVWWLARRQNGQTRADAPAERLDTLVGWPPEPTRILRPPERLALSTLKLALPGYLILAQVPIARFIAVPKRNSYAEWMRRLGSQCVDFVVCDVTSQVVAAVEVRPPIEQIDERVRHRLDRVARSLKAAGIPLHVWNEQRLPTIEAAREKLLPNAPAIPTGTARKPATAPAGIVPSTAMRTTAAPRGAAAVAALASESVADPLVATFDPFADADREWLKDGEIIVAREPSASSWFDELDSVTAELPPADRR